MEKITVKDIPIGIKIKVTKKRLLSIPKIVYDKVSKFYNNAKDKIQNYVTEEEKKNALKSELNKFDEKRKELSAVKKNLKKNEDISVNEKKYYLEAIEEELEKIKKKRKKRKNKGLGVFALGKLYVSKYINVQKEKSEKRKSKKELEKLLKEQLELEKEEQELKSKLDKLNSEKIPLIQNSEEIIKNNPSLKEYYKSISNEEKEKTYEKKIIPISAVRKATEEEKNEIKKSGKLKKALAAISAIVIAASVTMGTANLVNNNNINNPVIEKNIVYSQEENTQDNNISLNDYVKLDNGSMIFDSPTFNGKSGKIGTNGYDNNTLFKINAISCIDENNSITVFNLVEQSEENKKTIIDSYNKYMKENPNAVMNAVHITPCNEYGESTMTTELGGWTNTSKAQINKVDLKNTNINQQNLGGIVK